MLKGVQDVLILQLLGSTEALLASLKLNKQLTQIIDPLAQFNAPTSKESDGISWFPFLIGANNG